MQPSSVTKYRCDEDIWKMSLRLWATQGLVAGPTLGHVSVKLCLQAFFFFFFIFCI